MQVNYKESKFIIDKIKNKLTLCAVKYTTELDRRFLIKLNSKTVKPSTLPENMTETENRIRKFTHFRFFFLPLSTEIEYRVENIEIFL